MIQLQDFFITKNGIISNESLPSYPLYFNFLNLSNKIKKASYNIYNNNKSNPHHNRNQIETPTDQSHELHTHQPSESASRTKFSNYDRQNANFAPRQLANGPSAKIAIMHTPTRTNRTVTKLEIAPHTRFYSATKQYAYTHKQGLFSFKLASP